jgi:hypothetical protein
MQYPISFTRLKMPLPPVNAADSVQTEASKFFSITSENLFQSDETSLQAFPMQKKNIQPFAALRKSEQEKSVILDSMTELVLYLDTDLRVIWANKAMHPHST